MPTPARSVTQSTRSSADRPDCFSALAFRWRHLMSLGLVDAVSEYLTLHQMDGCCGVQLFGYLMAMWPSDQVGQRAARGHTQELAALLGPSGRPRQRRAARHLVSYEPGG